VSIRALTVLCALVGTLATSNAYANVFVYAVVDNQTSSPVLLGGSDTRGVFTSGPLGSVSGGTLISAATTQTLSLYEEGYVAYGPCFISWDVRLGYYSIDSSTYTYGGGCAGTVAAEIPTGPYSAVIVVRLTIN